MLYTSITIAAFLIFCVITSSGKVERERAEGKEFINDNPVIATFYKTFDNRPVRKTFLYIYAVIFVLFMAPIVIFGIDIPVAVPFILVGVFLSLLVTTTHHDNNYRYCVSETEVEFYADIRRRTDRHIVKIRDIEKMELVKMSLLFSQGYHSSHVKHGRSKAVMYVQGNRAVKITLSNGRRVFASMDEPKEFMTLVHEKFMKIKND